MTYGSYQSPFATSANSALNKTQTQASTTSIKTGVLDSVDYYIASSLPRGATMRTEGLSASLSAKGFTGLPAKTSSAQAHFAPTSSQYMVETEPHATNTNDVRSLVREQKESFPNYNGNYSRIAFENNSCTSSRIHYPASSPHTTPHCEPICI